MIKGQGEVVRIFDVPVHRRSLREVLEEMEQNIVGERQPMHIAITSSELMYHARRAPFLPAYVRRSRLSLCDGVGVAMNALVRGSLISRCTGPMLMENALSYGVARGWRHFFCGGAEGVAQQLVERATAANPGLITAGTYTPPFRELSAVEEDEMVALINSSGADIVWVGLGVVKQELFIDRYLSRLRVPWLIGVGAAFDFLAGTVRRAPRMVRALGMEWFYRVTQEPWRYRRVSTQLMFGIEGVLDAVFGRAPYLGSGPASEVRVPEWKREGRRKQPW